MSKRWVRNCWIGDHTAFWIMLSHTFFSLGWSNCKYYKHSLYDGKQNKWTQKRHINEVSITGNQLYWRFSLIFFAFVEQQVWKKPTCYLPELQEGLKQNPWGRARSSQEGPGPARQDLERGCGGWEECNQILVSNSGVCLSEKLWYSGEIVLVLSGSCGLANW